MGLNDQQVADVLSYVRANFSNKATAVTPEEVKTVRAATADRTALWTAEDLAK
jgi:mono/diheme cytochrome c family protein